MKIEFLTQQDPLYILPFFEEFLGHYTDRWQITRVSYCKTMGKRSRKQLVRELVQLYRPTGFARLAMKIAGARLASTLPLGPGARRYYSLAQLCRAHRIPFGYVDDPNAPSFVEQVGQRASDLLVSVACPYILKAPLLSKPRLGCLNIHHAPLPDYRGMMPTFWQLYHGSPTVGLTIHSMVDKLDRGEALVQEDLAVRSGETLDELIRRSKRHAAHSLARALGEMEDNRAVKRPLDTRKGSYFTFPTAAEIREFHRRGLRAI